MKGFIEVEFAGHAFHLLPDRAMWWPGRSTLVIADAHFGKSASFRGHGVPVPAGSTTKDLARLTSLLRQTEAKRLIVLGDFLHSRAGRQAEVFDAIGSWRELHASVPVLLVRGNHDRSAGRVPIEWRFEEVEEPFLDDGIYHAHDPARPSSGPTLTGHVHPVVTLRDYDGSGIALPCFIFDPTCVILPSFGTFTGGHTMRHEPERRIYVVAGDRIICHLMKRTERRRSI